MNFIDKIKALFGFGPVPVEKVSPTVRLQLIINEQAHKLIEGQAAARLSADLVRRLQQERDCLGVDVKTLENRLKELVSGQAAYSMTEKRLAAKQKDFENKSNELEKAAEDHRQNLVVISEYNDVITKARTDANRQKIDLDMAKVSEQSARFQSSISIDGDSAAEVRDQIDSEIRKARATAEAARMLSPNKASDEEFLKAAEGK